MKKANAEREISRTINGNKQGGAIYGVVQNGASERGTKSDQHTTVAMIYSPEGFKPFIQRCLEGQKSTMDFGVLSWNYRSTLSWREEGVEISPDLSASTMAAPIPFA